MGTRQVNEKTVDYYLLAEDIADVGENYGIRIIHGEEGESVCGITVSQHKILALLYRLMEGLATPTTLRDVVEDWLLC